MRPKLVPAARLATGLPRLARLNALKASHRSSSRLPSQKVTTLESERSKVTVPGPVRMLRPALPYCPGAFATNFVMSK